MHVCPLINGDFMSSRRMIRKKSQVISSERNIARVYSVLEILYLHQCSCFMIGKEPRIAEILLVHPTISKQHAVIQFKKHKDGSVR
jgi:hypothetical protein